MTLFGGEGPILWWGAPIVEVEPKSKHVEWETMSIAGVYLGILPVEPLVESG